LGSLSLIWNQVSRVVFIELYAFAIKLLSPDYINQHDQSASFGEKYQYRNENRGTMRRQSCGRKLYAFSAIKLGSIEIWAEQYEKINTKT